MDIKKIMYLSYQFRRGIEVAYDNGFFTKPPFSNFPNACCDDAPELLAQYLIDNDMDQNIRCRRVYGTYRYDDFENIYGHAWLVVNNSYIVDITADQNQFLNERLFPQDAVKSCYVGTNSQFHSIFEIESLQCRECFGLLHLGECSYKRMKELYDIILSCID